MSRRLFGVILALTLIVGGGFFAIQWWQNANRCRLYTNHTEEVSGYLVTVKLILPVKEEDWYACRNQLWVKPPDGQEWQVQEIGDIPYAFRIQGNLMTFTAASYQIDDRSWAIVNLNDHTITYQDDHPFLTK